MPRAFLIKKHGSGRELVKSQATHVDERNEIVELKHEDDVLKSVIPTGDGRGPYDLSVKVRKLDSQDFENIGRTILRPSTVIEFSPKIVISSNTATPQVGVSVIDHHTLSPGQLLKPDVPLEPLNPNTPPTSKTPTWHRHFISPAYPPFSFPLYPLPRHVSDIYASPTPYLGVSLISPTLLTFSPPRSSMAPALEQTSPCNHRENLSPTSSFYSNLPVHDRGHSEIPVSVRKGPTSYHTPWLHKEGSTSPTPRSDSSDSGQDSAHFSKDDLLNCPARGFSRALPSGVQAPRYQCVDCNKSYSTYSGLSRHRQFHCITQAKKSFNCKYCDKVYVSLGALKMHIRTHTLPCKCKLCGKAFSRPWLLQGHVRTHTGEKPFACPHCSRAFADRSNLRAHLQTHSDVKKYSCKVCSKTFSRMSLLLKHGESGCTAQQTR